MSMAARALNFRNLVREAFVVHMLPCGLRRSTRPFSQLLFANPHEEMMFCRAR